MRKELRQRMNANLKTKKISDRFDSTQKNEIKDNIINNHMIVANLINTFVLVLNTYFSSMNVHINILFIATNTIITIYSLALAVFKYSLFDKALYTAFIKFQIILTLLMLIPFILELIEYIKYFPGYGIYINSQHGSKYYSLILELIPFISYSTITISAIRIKEKLNVLDNFHESNY